MESKQTDSDVFWGEISPCEHLVQFYQGDAPFLDALEGFIGGGLQAGDAAVVIATPSHLSSLNARLRARNIDLDRAIAADLYIALDARETLDKFMRNGWPDEDLFHQCVRAILGRARSDGRAVRAFGEMVALMWAEGQCGATVRLEHLWHALCQEEAFALFCAYPKSGSTMDSAESIQEICDAHSRVIN